MNPIYRIRGHMPQTEYLFSRTVDLFIILLHNQDAAVTCPFPNANELHRAVTELSGINAGEFIAIQYTGKPKDCPHAVLRKGAPVAITQDLCAIAENPGKAGLDAYDFVLTDKKKLEAFIASYLDVFESGLCHETGNNYISYKSSMEFLEYLFGASYAKFGARFNITAEMADVDFSPYFSTHPDCDDPWEFQTDFLKRLRLGELLLSLARKKYISILDAVHDDEKNNLCALVHFERSPQEIREIEGYWLAYGGLRVNDQDGVAFYKNHRYPFATSHTLEFRLLCHLIKNHGKKLDIGATYDQLSGSSDTFGDGKATAKLKKARIKDYIKNLRCNLGIADDKNPSVDIMLTGDTVLLIATPPAST